MESEPVTSGYRLRLMYDLHQSQTVHRSNSGRPSASHLSQQINVFRDLLGQWTTLSQRHEGPVPLVYILDDDELGEYKRDRCVARLSKTPINTKRSSFSGNVLRRKYVFTWRG